MPASKPVFVDTSGWIAILNTRDQDHAEAAGYWRQFVADRRIAVTTDWVLAETGNGLARTAARAGFPKAVRKFLQAPDSRVVRIDEAIFEQALDLYARMDDKSWGLVDCASFVVMQTEGIIEAFSSDRHDQQAGFRLILPVAG